MNGAVWSEEQVATLRRMRAEGKSASQIGLAVGLSRLSVLGKAHRLGILLTRPEAEPKRPRRAPPQEKRVRVWDMDDVDGVTSLPPDQSPCAVRLLDAKPHQCRWPIEQPGQPMMFCGDQVVGGHSWCPRHYRIAFRPPAERRGRAA